MVVGMVFQTGADVQIARFKADPNDTGVVLGRALWRFTRHPNHLGDA